MTLQYACQITSLYVTYPLPSMSLLFFLWIEGTTSHHHLHWLSLIWFCSRLKTSHNIQWHTILLREGILSDSICFFWINVSSNVWIYFPHFLSSFSLEVLIFYQALSKLVMKNNSPCLCFFYSARVSLKWKSCTSMSGDFQRTLSLFIKLDCKKINQLYCILI